MVPVRLLGPVEVADPNGERIPLGAPKQRTALALLLVRAGEVVTIDDLVDELWNTRPPRSAVANVRTYVANLRRLFAAYRIEGVTLVGHGAGYRLDLAPGHADHAVFGTHVERGRQARVQGDTDRAVTEFELALGLWRGAPMQDVAHGRALAARRAALDEERAMVTEDLADLLLAAGRVEGTVPLLRRHTTDHPLRERGWALLMRALDRLGDRAGALATFTDARAVLVERLGIEPGPDLKQLQRALLQADDVPPAAPPVEPVGGRSVEAPAQLPAGFPGFVGRAGLLADLDALVDGDAGRSPPVVVLTGTAGVGKTTLAVHWAHRVADRFPDGQLYVNLHGFDPHRPTTAPMDAVRGFLEAFGVASDQVPSDLDARAAVYRSLLGGKRILVVLDNARDADQVRPLLPGDPGCLAVVTSRNPLTGLVATNGAVAHALGILSVTEARELLTQRLGADRVAAEPGATDEIIAACARLPLALGIAAARARQTGFSLAVLAGELRTADERLGALDLGDPATDVRTVFSWSYTALTAPAAHLFRCLGGSAGPDIGRAAAASLIGLPPRQVRTLLAELVDAHLLAEHLPHRYASHDLLRVYAAELAAEHDDDAERRARLRRLLDHYLHTANTATHLITDVSEPLDLAPPQPGVTPEHLPDRAAALDWFTAERATVLGAIGQAHAAGLDTHAWQLTWTVEEFLDLRGHWDDWLAVQHLALDSARRLGDLRMQAYSERRLGRGYVQTGRFDDAEPHYDQALRLYEQLGDLLGRANTHFSRCWWREMQERPLDARDETTEALNLYRAAGHDVGEARALNSLAWCLANLGDLDQALAHGTQALALNQKLGDGYGEAAIRDTLGFTHHQLGNHREALDCYGQSLALFRQAEDRYNQADVLTHRGDAHHAAGDHDAARADWLAAAEILDALAHPFAAAVHARLAGGGVPAS